MENTDRKAKIEARWVNEGRARNMLSFAFAILVAFALVSEAEGAEPPEAWSVYNIDASSLEINPEQFRAIITASSSKKTGRQSVGKPESTDNESFYVKLYLITRASGDLGPLTFVLHTKDTQTEFTRLRIMGLGRDEDAVGEIWVVPEKTGDNSAFTIEKVLEEVFIPDVRAVRTRKHDVLAPAVLILDGEREQVDAVFSEATYQRLRQNFVTVVKTPCSTSAITQPNDAVNPVDRLTYDRAIGPLLQGTQDDTPNLDQV